MDNETLLALSEQGNRDWADRNVERMMQLERRISRPIDQVIRFRQQTKGNRMLDVGCSWGRYVDLFTERKFEYTGIDVSAGLIEKARERRPSLTFKQMSFRKLDFPDASFDGVWCCCALGFEPKANLIHVIPELCRVLVPGGILSIIMPDFGVSGEGFETESGIETYHAVWAYNELAYLLAYLRLNVVYHESKVLEFGAMEFIIRK